MKFQNSASKTNKIAICDETPANMDTAVTLEPERDSAAKKLKAEQEKRKAAEQRADELKKRVDELERQNQTANLEIMRLKVEVYDLTHGLA